MSNWNHLQEYIASHYEYGDEFTVHDYADATGIDIEDASANIQAHLDAQRRPGAPTLATLWREGRTTAAKWRVGDKVGDVMGLIDTFQDDVRVKVRNAILPDLHSITNHNHRLRRRVENEIDRFVGELMTTVRAEVDIWREGQEEGS